jgi:hypothetical protein
MSSTSDDVRACRAIDPRIGTPARRIERAKPGMSTARRDGASGIGATRRPHGTLHGRGGAAASIAGREAATLRLAVRMPEMEPNRHRGVAQWTAVSSFSVVFMAKHSRAPDHSDGRGPFCPARAAMCRSRFRRSQRDPGERGWEQHGYSEPRAAPFNRRLDPRRGCSAPRGFSKL